MLKKIIQRMVKKWGAKKLLFFVLDQCVKATKSGEDDKMLEEMKTFLADY